MCDACDDKAYLIRKLKNDLADAKGLKRCGHCQIALVGHLKKCPLFISKSTLSSSWAEHRLRDQN